MIPIEYFYFVILSLMGLLLLSGMRLPFWLKLTQINKNVLKGVFLWTRKQETTEQINLTLTIPNTGNPEWAISQARRTILL
jgi:hypothetical protein